MGETVRALHNRSAPEENLPIPNWDSFLDSQIKRCVAHQTSEHINNKILDEIPIFLDMYLPSINHITKPSILHTELSYDVWLIDKPDNEWELTGLFDFGDAMLGNPEADFFCRLFEHSLLKSYLNGYGYKENEQTKHLACRMFAFFLLHRYATLHWLFNDHPDILAHSTSLEELALYLTEDL
jgi:aminoglycoside phosphotransferase (APT) family kinase protein